MEHAAIYQSLVAELGEGVLELHDDAIHIAGDSRPAEVTGWIDEEARHADRVQPGRDLLAFQIPGQIPITSTRTNNDRCAGVLLLGRPKYGDRRFRDIGEPLRVFRRRFFGCTDAFGADPTVIFRNRARPDRQHPRFFDPGSRANQSRERPATGQENSE